MKTRGNVSVRSRSIWNLEVLVFKGREKPEYSEKNLTEQGREPVTNSTHKWHRRQDSNPGHFATLKWPIVASFSWNTQQEPLWRREPPTYPFTWRGLSGGSIVEKYFFGSIRIPFYPLSSYLISYFVCLLVNNLFIH